MPGKPAKVLTQKKKVVKPVRDSKVPTELVRGRVMWHLLVGRVLWHLLVEEEQH